MLSNPEISRMIVHTFEGDWISPEEHLRDMLAGGGGDPEYSGYGQASFLSGHKYQGQFLKGALHGQGQYTWRDGVVFTGEFKENRIEGRGKYQWKDGCTYTGQVVSGLRHGTGLLKCPDGLSYDGEWKKGRPNGSGRVYYSQDSYYDGEWLDGQPHGQGTMKYASGNMYEGSWANGVKEGLGKMTWSDRGELYEGSWINGKPNGYGVYVWTLRSVRDHQNPTQNRYEGEWKDGKRNGHGVFRYASGALYDGQWQDNRKHGKGKYISENGRYHIGSFLNDRPVEPFKAYSNDIPFMFSLPNVQDKDTTQLLKEVNAAIFRHIGDLRVLYHQYSHEYEDSKHYKRKVLRRNDMWTLLRDLKLVHEGFTLAELDRAYVRMLKDHVCFSDRYHDPHDPATEFIFYDFLQFLIAVAHLVYQKSPDLSIHESSLASCFSKLMKQNARQLVSKTPLQQEKLPPLDEFYAMLKKEAEEQYAAIVYKVVQLFGRREVNALHDSKKDKTITIRHFLLSLKQYGLLQKWSPNVNLTTIIQSFAEQIPLVIDTDCYNLDFELVHLDVFDGLYRIALKFVDANVPDSLAQILEIAMTSQIDWKQEFHAIKMSDKQVRQLAVASPLPSINVHVTTTGETIEKPSSSKRHDSVVLGGTNTLTGSKVDLMTAPPTPQTSLFNNSSHGTSSNYSSNSKIAAKVSTPQANQSLNGSNPGQSQPAPADPQVVGAPAHQSQQRHLSVDIQGADALLVTKSNDNDMDSSSKASDLQASLNLDPLMKVHATVVKMKAAIAKTFHEFMTAHEAAMKEVELFQRGQDRERLRHAGKEVAKLMLEKQLLNETRSGAHEDGEMNADGSFDRLGSPIDETFKNDVQIQVDLSEPVNESN